ncbi:MAG TPA: bifunctional 2-polyprenyl-6-hydroxyphenol methylase/3-demethylubiquinol 3-O-methyltransferase UbiG [Polyangiaceae bacterium]|nr:bifunctional 2-polyprenyl-6-hydroxyphenol methylase/3-demethylubiquinol 3-O-methyltransferase UbiG [Polyangiaceae bacterium]
MTTRIDNAFYDTLGERWYGASDDPVALLRAESRLRNPWLCALLKQRHGANARVLDIACGAGFLSNALAEGNFDVTGVDASPESLNVARDHDVTGTARYEVADALALPYADASFDAACAMDFLEHVSEPARAIREAARVLRPGGTFVFHTFNRNWLAHLVVIKGVEWFVKNTPDHMHVIELFIKPEECKAMCEASGLRVLELRGSRPVLSKAFFRMLMTREVPPDFSFRFTSSTRIAYTGYAEKL